MLTTTLTRRQLWTATNVTEAVFFRVDWWPNRRRCIKAGTRGTIRWFGSSNATVELADGVRLTVPLAVLR